MRKRLKQFLKKSPEQREQEYGEQGEQENKRDKGDLQLVPMRIATETKNARV